MCYKKCQIEDYFNKILVFFCFLLYCNKNSLTHFCLYYLLLLLIHNTLFRGFGGLEVACWPLVPKFAGSHPAEAVGFLRAKKSSAPLPSEGK